MDTTELKRKITNAIYNQNAHIQVGDPSEIIIIDMRVHEGFASENLLYITVRLSYLVGLLSDNSPVSLDWMYTERFPVTATYEFILEQFIRTILMFKGKYIPMMQGAFNSVSNARYFNK
jgi:hypothetical protein